MDLLELRKEIDRIDDQLIPLLMARMDVSEQVAKYKVERGIPVLYGRLPCAPAQDDGRRRRFKKRDHGSLAGRPHCCGTR